MWDVVLELSDCPERKLSSYLEWEVLEVMLDGGVVPIPADQPLGVKDSVLRVARQLIFGGVSNETLALSSKGYVRGGDSVTLIVGDYLHSPVLKDTNTKKKQK